MSVTNDASPDTAPKDGADAPARSAARLAAVQALYQMELSGAGAADITRSFLSERPGGDLEGVDYTHADARFFRDLIQGVVERQVRIDNLVNDDLAEGWRLSRLDSILRAILRTATYELLARDDIPARVVIDEYVDVANAFFEGTEPGFVNGILDRLAHDLRADEFGETP